jgi:hypothetical protein
MCILLLIELKVSGNSAPIPQYCTFGNQFHRFRNFLTESHPYPHRQKTIRLRVRMKKEIIVSEVDYLLLFHLSTKLYLFDDSEHS